MLLATPLIEQAKDGAAVIAAAIALATLIKGVLEYVHQGAQKRAEQFVAIRQRLKSEIIFKEICDLLETDDVKLAEIPFKDKRDFLGLFEEIALMLNSHIIRPAVAHYMFGYYAIRCAKSRNFWTTVNRNSVYWALFNDFVSRMEHEEANFRFERRRMKF